MELRRPENDVSRTGEPCARRRGAVELELADVLIYLVRLADVLNIDLLEAGSRKIAINSERFLPVEAD